MSAHIEPVTGRYLQLEIESASHRVYFEEAGHGIPLLCLHTAGADGRQYRAIVNDEEITSRFRVIVPDMPWHGKSSPPEGWQDQQYLLTTDRYLNFVTAFMRALELDRPVVIGCSIGGRAVLHLALRHASLVRGIISLQAGLHAGGNSQNPTAANYLHRHDVHGGEASAGIVSGLIAPQSPDKERWETLWHYASGGPGVFQGDLFYYLVDGDLRNQPLDIDTETCPVYLLSGEYDYSAPPEGAEEICRRIKGAHFQKMAEMGHFPMSENPQRFKRYLLPVLAEFHARG